MLMSKIPQIGRSLFVFYWSFLASIFSLPTLTHTHFPIPNGPQDESIQSYWRLRGPAQDMARRGVAVAPTAHANWRTKPMGERNFERNLQNLEPIFFPKKMEHTATLAF